MAEPRNPNTIPRTVKSSLTVRVEITLEVSE